MSRGHDGDVLAGVGWTCADCAPDAATAPPGPREGWIPATVPGTAASALCAHEGSLWTLAGDDRLDGRDWWFRCRLPAATGDAPHELCLDGLATLADVWLDGEHVLRSENMFLAHRVPVRSAPAGAELVLRFAALASRLAPRRPRPRWKSRLVRSQSLRWERTTLLGRMPGPAPTGAPVGPWRPVRLVPVAPLRVLGRTLHAACTGDGGTVTVAATLSRPAGEAWLHAGGERVALRLTAAGGGCVATGSLSLASVEPWWPHTHGGQPLYGVELEVDGVRLPLGRVGFRTVTVDRADGAFALRVNGVPVFCRGAVWDAPDTVAFAATPEDVRASVGAARDAGMNLLRVPGYTTYQDAAFWDACDELGVLVWQDCMLASVDPPEEEAFVAGLETELRQALGGLQGRPALAVACGSSETHQQAAMFGAAPGGWDSVVLDEVLPALVGELLPGVPYVPSRPPAATCPSASTWGSGTTSASARTCARSPTPGCAACASRPSALSFGHAARAETVDEVFGGAGAIGQSLAWKAAVARDAGTAWDFEDVRDHYVRELFGVDPLAVRYEDPELALDYGRAAVAEAMSVVMTEWRRAASLCAGAVVLTWQDRLPGAGWGLRDALGRPKAPLFALRRVLAPTAVLLSDEGLGGLRLHVVHDGPRPLDARVRVRMLRADGSVLEAGERDVRVAPHGEVELSAELVLGGFRDISRAPTGSRRRRTTSRRSRSSTDKGRRSTRRSTSRRGRRGRARATSAAARRRDADGDGPWALTVSAARFAQYVAIDSPGLRPSDSWFHLAAGTSATVTLHGDPARRPSGTVRALNAVARASIHAEAPA